MWVKICGITRYEDACTACEAGADAIGFVLTRSRRRVDPALVDAWIHRITGVEKVGVFMDEDPGYILETAKMLGLHTIQLHVPLSPGHRILFERFEMIYSVKRLDGLPMPKEFPCRILFDPSTGTGKAGTWRPYDIPYILAGGLTPENVRQAILQAGPAGVDVSSGVESSPGIKDAERIRKFIQEAKA